jgi:excinuclease UvrABC ATPase subunit
MMASVFEADRHDVIEVRGTRRTVIVIEHHMAVMAHADWIIDLGPGAGHDGGRIVFTGPPSALIQADTLTGRHLRAYLA